MGRAWSASHSKHTYPSSRSGQGQPALGETATATTFSRKDAGAVCGGVHTGAPGGPPTSTGALLLRGPPRALRHPHPVPTPHGSSLEFKG